VEELDLVRLDQEIRSAARAWRRWRRRLRHGVLDDQGPFAPFPSVTRETFLAVRDRPEQDPLRLPLMRWLYRLLDDKANRVVLSRESAARAVVTHALDEPERVTLSPRGMLDRALRDGARRDDWLRCFFEHGDDVAHAARLHAERRGEVATRLGQPSPASLTWPSAELADSAESWLALSADAASEHRREAFCDVIELGLAKEANRGVPSRFAPDTLGHLFRETALLDSLPLEPGDFPAAIAPASFLRALRRLGAAFSDASAARDQPFVIATDPYGLRRFTLGVLFSLLPLEPAFARRALGLSPGALADHGRALARSLLLDSRAAALRVLLAQPALGGARAFGSAFESGVERAFGCVLEAERAGLVFRLHADDAQRFAGLMLAASEAATLLEAHDEDWFRNPRAADQLRAEAALPPATTTSREALDAGARTLLARLARPLG
jgi:hypothetical protein